MSRWMTAVNASATEPHLVLDSWRRRPKSSSECGPLTSNSARQLCAWVEVPPWHCAAAAAAAVCYRFCDRALASTQQNITYWREGRGKKWEGAMSMARARSSAANEEACMAQQRAAGRRPERRRALLFHQQQQQQLKQQSRVWPVTTAVRARSASSTHLRHRRRRRRRRCCRRCGVVVFVDSHHHSTAFTCRRRRCPSPSCSAQCRSK